MADTHHPPNKSDVEELADILMILQRCFMFNLTKELQRGKVSFAQFFLMGYLGQRGQLNMTLIAEKMGHTTAAATGLVDRLEKLGYVRRSNDKVDRRKVFVGITRKGEALVARIRQDMVENLEQVMLELTPEEQSAWLSIYRKINKFCHGK